MKKRLLTGLQPTGSLTIGNFCGGINQILKYRENYETFLFVPDLHSITVSQNPEALRTKIRETVAIYLAAGCKADGVHIYLQSENIYHTALSWILECHSYFGELRRMHQFKEKSQKNENFSCGLFTYPVLMAADILLYGAHAVPTGEDQKQHVELARNLAERFNNKYGKEYFVIPEPIIPPVGARIRDLLDPSKKMSKSAENPKGSVFLLDPEEVIRKKIMGAKTDSDGVVAFDEENKPGISNLLTIYSVFAGTTIPQAAAHFASAGYGELKKAVTSAVAERLIVIQDNYKRIITSGAVDDVLDAGKILTNSIAAEKYEQIRYTVGVGR